VERSAEETIAQLKSKWIIEGFKEEKRGGFKKYLYEIFHDILPKLEICF